MDEDLLEDAKFGIEGHLRSGGYCRPRADYTRADSPELLRIVFTVSRGPRCVIDRVQVTGNTSIGADELLPLVRSQQGQPFDESLLGGDAARIQGFYRRRGFVDVKVASQIETGEVRAGTAPVNAQLVITEGARHVIASVVFEGNSGMPAEALRQAIVSAPGQPYFEPQVAADATALGVLYLNGGYPESTVQPAPRRSPGSGDVEVRFLIHEGPQVVVDHVLIIGNERTRRETIARAVQFTRGAPLSQQDEDETRARLTALGIFRRVDISYHAAPGHRDAPRRADHASKRRR